MLNPADFRVESFRRAQEKPPLSRDLPPAQQRLHTKPPIAAAFAVLCWAHDRACAGCGGVMIMPCLRPPPDFAPAVPFNAVEGSWP